MDALHFLPELNLSIGSAKKSAVLLAYRLADDGGTIQSQDMLRLTRDPAKHTTTSLRSALLMLGCVERSEH